MLPIAIFEGPIVTVIGGFLSAHNLLNPYIVFSISILGDLVGDLLYYILGRWGRSTFLMRWAGLLGATDERVEKLERHFEKHSGKTLVVGKLTHGVGSMVLIAAGASRMSVGKFVFYNVLSSLPKSLAFVLVGYYYGQAYRQISGFLNYVALALLGLVAAFLLFYLVKRLRERFKI